MENRRCWVVSPNAKAQGDIDYWLERSRNEKKVFMGWGSEDKLGRVFENNVAINDYVIIAKGARDERKLYLGGVVISNRFEQPLGEEVIYYRCVNYYLFDDDFVNNQIEINSDNAYGESSNPGAIYELKANTAADKIVIDKISILINKKIIMEDQKKINDLLKYKKQIILQGPPGTGKTYNAKGIAELLIFGNTTINKKEQKAKLEATEQFKLIQFHPAYSYEDFVRGIIAEAKDGTIEYKAKNKILSEFAGIALMNYQDSRKDSKQLSLENWFNDKFKEFTQFVIDKIEENEGKLFLDGTTTYLKQVEEDCFRYTGDKWNNIVGNRMLFKDILEMYKQKIRDRQSIKKMDGVSGLARQHASYYMKVLDLLYTFMDGKETPALDGMTIKEKPFILIIDEINRANLPAVLGELIYALEYRGESVESMYDIDEDRSLILPPNLYIIGTMNTADRSVGHIDYAIRRRFAFVDIFPSSLPIDTIIKDSILNQKAKVLFEKVSALFYEKQNDLDQQIVYLQADFKKNDVQLGHSYFLADSEETLKLKLEFEIKPILFEYIKDGLLSEDARVEIKKLAV